MKVVVADDHALIREGMRHLLCSAEEGCQVLEAENFEETLGLLEKHKDLCLVLLDLNMPGMEGVSSLKAVREKLPSAGVVILSASENRGDIRRALDAGAAGYIPKSSTNEVMLSALKLILSGGVYVPPVLVSGGGASPAPPVFDGGAPSLTGRQSEVLALMAEGQSNKEIARSLDLSESTVKAHVSAIMRLLKAANRGKAIKAAADLGLVYGD